MPVSTARLFRALRSAPTEASTIPWRSRALDEEKHEHFLQTAFQIKRRVELFNSLPIEKLDHLQREVHTRQVHEHAEKPQTDRITSA